jgi:glycosyltransferase involved in cell wall biosynthesis
VLKKKLRCSKREVPPMSRLQLSVIVPAYKQEKTIAKDLKRIRKVLNKLRYKSELICVVDGLVDKTYDMAKQVEKVAQGVKVYSYHKNMGKGYAVRYGMAKSRGKVIAFIDAGMDINPNGISMCLEHLEWYGADIIVGSKRHPASKILEYPWQRRILSLGYQGLARVLFNLNIRDTQTGMKFFKREVLEKVLDRLLNKKFAFDVEMLSVAHRLGFKRIYEAPVELKMEFEASTIATKGFMKTAVLMLWETLAIFYRLKLIGYYDDKNVGKWKYEPELSFRFNIT